MEGGIFDIIERLLRDYYMVIEEGIMRFLVFLRDLWDLPLYIR